MTEKQFPKIYLYKRLVHAKLFIDKHFAECIDLNNIADEAYFSKFHFIRLFKRIYGKTPHHYLTQVRIENAKVMLLSNVSIADVCNAVGFESATSFATLFKKSTGVSPSVFQSRQHQRASEMISTPLRFVPNCFAVTHGWTSERQ